MQQLEDCVRLTQSKRIEIAENQYAQAKMHSDSVKEAEDFLMRWRRSRRLLYRENLVPLSLTDVLENVSRGNISRDLAGPIVTDYEKREAREMQNFLNQRISNSIRIFILSRETQPRSIDDCIKLIEQWIVANEHSNKEPKGIKVIDGIPVAVVDGHIMRVQVDPEFDLDAASNDYDQENQQDVDGQISKFGKGRGAGHSASKTNTGRQNPKGGAPAVAAPPPGTPQCPTCKGYHPDIRTCPNTLARQDNTFVSTPGAKCSWKVNGKFSCSGFDHFGRHHRQQWINENPGKPVPNAPSTPAAKSKSTGGARSKGKGKYKGKSEVQN